MSRAIAGAVYIRAPDGLREAKITCFSTIVAGLWMSGCGAILHGSESTAPLAEEPVVHPQVALMPSPYEAPSSNPNSNENRASNVALPSAP